MKAHWQTYVICLFCRHLDYFAAILEAKKILPTLYYGPRAGQGQKICCSLAERAGPGSFMLAPGGPGCAGPCCAGPKVLARAISTPLNALGLNLVTSFDKKGKICKKG